MTLIYERDLQIIKLYLYIKNERLGQGFQNLFHSKRKNKDAQTDATKVANELPFRIRGW